MNPAKRCLLALPYVDFRRFIFASVRVALDGVIGEYGLVPWDNAPLEYGSEHQERVADSFLSRVPVMRGTP